MTYNWDWQVFFHPSVTGEGSYGQMLIVGLGWTVLLSAISWLVALVIGTLAGIGRTMPNRWISGLCLVFVHVFRNTPLLVQLFIWYFVLPELLPVSWGDAIKGLNPTINAILTVLICLTLYTAAKAAEVIRSGIESLPAGQAKAARALGMKTVDVYRYILLPQAFRIIIPPLTSDFMNVIKNSAVALTIGLMELTGQTRQIAEFSAQPLETFVAATVIYMALAYAVVHLMNWIERRSVLPGTSGA